MTTANFTVADLNVALCDVLLGVEMGSRSDGLYWTPTVCATDRIKHERVRVDTAAIYMLGVDAHDPDTQRALLRIRRSCITIGSLACSQHSPNVRDYASSHGTSDTRRQHMLLVPGECNESTAGILATQVRCVLGLLGPDANPEDPVLYIPDQQRIVADPHTIPFIAGVYASAQDALRGRAT